MRSYLDERESFGDGEPGPDREPRDLSTSGDTVSELPKKLQKEQDAEAERKLLEHLHEVYHGTIRKWAPEKENRENEDASWRDERVRRLLGNSFAMTPADVRAAEAQANRELRKRQQGRENAAEVSAMRNVMLTLPANDADAVELRSVWEKVEESGGFSPELEALYKRLANRVGKTYGASFPSPEEIAESLDYNSRPKTYPYR